MPVSVNVSRADFYHADLADVLLSLIRKYDLAPADLHLEITESVYTENPNHIMRMISKLRNMGFVTELAHWKKFKVVAEGIETKEELQRIKRIGCDYAQGYYFSKSLCKQDFEKNIRVL